MATSFGSSARTVGSPPVIRIPSIANRSTHSREILSISSKLRISSRASHCKPSAGMQ
jgi:hypothetical protein